MNTCIRLWDLSGKGLAGREEQEEAAARIFEYQRKAARLRKKDV
jgi:hypothetical protein